MLTSYNNLAKAYTNWSGHMTKMATTPIYGKNLLKNLQLQNQKVNDFVAWYVLCSIGNVGSTKFVQMMILG